MRSGDLRADPVAEAVRVMHSAEQADVVLRTIGGVAVVLRATVGIPAQLRCAYRGATAPDLLKPARSTQETSSGEAWV
jgi:hypothetical protein